MLALKSVLVFLKVLCKYFLGETSSRRFAEIVFMMLSKFL